MRKRYNGRELNEHYSVASLRRKGVEINDKKISIKNCHLGNKSWGLIDFLTNYKGYYKW